ncbi:MAG: hypothetical protein SFX72_11645 [Isosphaeraceae bacterium]|nr:hypothetical protein [Isosphaeraceae bacterium]
MVRRYVTRALSVGLALAAAFSGLEASAATIGGSNGLIKFTGNVETDMPLGVIPGNQIVDGGPPTRVAQAQWMTDAGYTTGWAMKDVRFNYDDTSDTLQVGINFYGIAGDADGNGDPGGADARTVAAGGLDLAHMGGRKSISVAFAPDSSSGPSSPGGAVVVAGISADKTKAGPGINGFNVASYVASNKGIAYNYGQTLSNHLGELAFDPSAATPDFQFSIEDFSKIPGLNSSSGFWFQVYAGSPDDVVAGEATVGWFRMNGRFSPQTIPEPATVLAWGTVAGIAAWSVRRSRRKAA